MGGGGAGGFGWGRAGPSCSCQLRQQQRRCAHKQPRSLATRSAAMRAAPLPMCGQQTCTGGQGQWAGIQGEPHVRRGCKGGLGGVDAHQVGGVVQRRQVSRLLDRSPHLVTAGGGAQAGRTAGEVRSPGRRGREPSPQPLPYHTFLHTQLYTLVRLNRLLVGTRTSSARARTPAVCGCLAKIGMVGLPASRRVWRLPDIRTPPPRRDRPPHVISTGSEISRPCTTRCPTPKTS